MRMIVFVRERHIVLCIHIELTNSHLCLMLFFSLFRCSYIQREREPYQCDQCSVLILLLPFFFLFIFHISFCVRVSRLEIHNNSFEFFVLFLFFKQIRSQSCSLQLSDKCGIEQFVKCVWCAGEKFDVAFPPLS